MPRIELIPSNFDPSTGDGSPTIDVCVSCDNFCEGDVIQSSEHGECEVGSIDVAHPPYDGCNYKCEECGELLGEEDD